MSKQLRPSYVVSRYDRGRHLLAPAGMWNPEAHRLGYRRVSQQDVFYFGRRHFLSTPVDQLFDPPDEAEKPVVVQPAEITRPKPTVERERRGIDLRVGVVRIDDVETTDDHFAYGAQAESGSRLVRNGDLDARSPAYRAGLARGWRQGVRGDLVGRLGHAECFQHRHVELALERLQRVRSQTRARGANEA